MLSYDYSFWINDNPTNVFLVFILAYKGPLNALLLGLGLLIAPIRFYRDWCVLIGMVYAYILFMIFPIY